MVCCVADESDDDFNIKEHVVNIADGRLLRHRREFLGDVETSRERVTKVGWSICCLGCFLFVCLFVFKDHHLGQNYS